METIIYEDNKLIRTEYGKDYTYLLNIYQLPNIHANYIKQHALNQYITLPPTNSLFFDSKFESGNLLKAVKTSNTYHLFLRKDEGCKQNKQWYFFAVHNTLPG